MQKRKEEHTQGMVRDVYLQVFFFVKPVMAVQSTDGKSVRLITKIWAVIKYIRIMEDIYRTFYIHSDILGHAELPSLLNNALRKPRKR